MKIIFNGRSRTVLVFNSISVKFPRIYWRRLFTCINSTILLPLNGRKKYRLNFIYKLNAFLLGPILHNLREYLFYREYKMSITAPTYFSLFGLLNIQKTVKPCTIQGIDLLDTIM